MAYALSANKHYTLGIPRLLVATDHKLKESTLNWNFSVMHVPGRIYVGPETLFRKEVSSVVVAMLGSITEPAEDSMDDMIEAEVAGNFLATGGQVEAVSLAPITWAQVKGEVSGDKVYSMLCSQIVDGMTKRR